MCALPIARTVELTVPIGVRLRRWETPMAHSLEATKPDLAAVKQRQQQTWASGDFSRRRGADRARRRAARATRPTCTPAGACSTSRPAAATRRSPPPGSAATAVGVDYVPALLERGRAARPPRASTSSSLEGDAEALPFADALVRRRHLGVRVDVRAGPRAGGRRARCASAGPGGTIALASWTPDGFIGELFRTVGAHVPPPAGVPSPMLWGTEGTCASCSATAIASLEVHRADVHVPVPLGGGVRRVLPRAGTGRR